jgi:DUF917 family protein
VSPSATRRGFLHTATLAGLATTGEWRAFAVPRDNRSTKPNPRARVLAWPSLEEILIGCSYLGCGGGGTLSEGLARLEDDRKAGRRFELLAVADLKDDQWAASPYGLGSNAPPSEAEKDRFADLPRAGEDAVESSFRLLGAYLHRPFVAVIAGELGPWSTAAALSTAARLGIPILDADRVGRATPEATQDSILAAGLPTTPLAAVTGFGDSLILEKVARGSRVEDLLRAISVTSLGELGVTDAALSGRNAKQPGVLVAGSLSHAEKLGQANRRAVATQGDPLEAVRAAGGGYRLFEGEVVDFPWKEDAGFLVGEVVIEGHGPFRGSRYRVWYKNENIISWRDDAISVTPPDLIAVADTKTGNAIANPAFQRGQMVTVLGFPAPALWRTPAGLRIFGPAHFGFDVPYVPIEERQRSEHPPSP